MRLFLVLAMLLAGCATNDNSVATDEPFDEAAEGATNELESSDSPAKLVQEATVDWVLPVSGHCVNENNFDRLTGTTHGYLDIDPLSWGKHFEAIFESSETNIGFDVGFYNDADLPIGGAVELAIDGGDGILAGIVPEDSAYALFSTCGGGTGADYRSGNIL